MSLSSPTSLEDISEDEKKVSQIEVSWAEAQDEIPIYENELEFIPASRTGSVASPAHMNSP